MEVVAPPEVFETGEWCMRYIMFWALPCPNSTSNHTWQLAIAQKHIEFDAFRYVLVHYKNHKIKLEAAPPDVPTEAVAAFTLSEHEIWDFKPSGECYKVEFWDRDLVEMLKCRKNQRYVFRDAGWQRNLLRWLVRKRVLRLKDLGVFDRTTRAR
ncbi:hypothetical protein OPQ81_010743 [Rhizoctonia solani]|nr:hypothetical protein OPQ81_010743 [Rhizoctonia solani]